MVACVAGSSIGGRRASSRTTRKEGIALAKAGHFAEAIARFERAIGAVSQKDESPSSPVAASKTMKSTKNWPRVGGTGGPPLLVGGHAIRGWDETR